jgi:hypothetical protein
LTIWDDGAVTTAGFVGLKLLEYVVVSPCSIRKGSGLFAFFEVPVLLAFELRRLAGGLLVLDCFGTAIVIKGKSASSSLRINSKK